MSVAPEGFVTYRELTNSQNEVKKEVNEDLNRVDSKVDGVIEKVNHLNDLVLPLTIAMKQTAENTKEISESLKEFTKSQSEANGIFNEKFHKHDIAIEGVRTITNGLSDKQKYNVSVTVAIIGLVGIIITSIFQLAPFVFGQ